MGLSRRPQFCLLNFCAVKRRCCTRWGSHQIRSQQDTHDALQGWIKGNLIKGFFTGMLAGLSEPTCISREPLPLLLKGAKARNGVTRSWQELEKCQQRCQAAGAVVVEESRHFQNPSPAGRSKAIDPRLPSPLTCNLLLVSLQPQSSLLSLPSS